MVNINCSCCLLRLLIVIINISMALLDKIPLPSPVSALTGAMQPFNSLSATLAGWKRIHFLS